MISQEKEHGKKPSRHSFNETCRHVNTDDDSELVDLVIKIEPEDTDGNMEDNLTCSTTSVSQKDCSNFSPLRVSGNSWCTDEIQDIRRGKMSTRYGNAVGNVHPSTCADTSTNESNDGIVTSQSSRRSYDDVSVKRFNFKHTQRTNFGCANVYIGSPKSSSEVTSKGRKVQPPLRFYDWLFPYD